MVRKTRVETYLHPDTVAQLENDIDMDKSAFVREAVNRLLDKHDEIEALEAGA